MTSTHKNKESIESDGLYKLLSQTDIQIIENNLFTKLITQKRKEMKKKKKKNKNLKKKKKKF